MSRYLNLGCRCLKMAAFLQSSTRTSVHTDTIRCRSPTEEPPSHSAEATSAGETRDFRSNDVLPKLREKHGARFDFGLEHVNSVCHYLTYEAADGEEAVDSVVEMFVLEPSLGDVPLRRWTDAMTVLRLSCDRLSVKAIVQMIAECPQIVRRATATQLESSIDVLRREHFAGEHLSLLLRRAPLLLVTSPNYLSERLRRLKGLVTHGDLFQLLPVCPNVLFDDWSLIDDVVQYVAFRVGLDQRQMINSRLLSHSLEHVRLRHQLMLRTGKFKRPHPKRHIPNPHLSQMVDTTVDQFVCSVGITVEEYRVFESICKYEVDKELIRLTAKQGEHDLDGDGHDASSSDDD